MFGDSFVYILFEDGTDLYWARSRVLEYLSQVQGRLPPSAKSALGPDATGVGWVYEYALVDRTGKHDLGQLTALQDWFLKYELKTVPNVAEVATIGGFVPAYQIVLNPDRMRAFRIPQSQIVEAVSRANNEAGGSVLELGEAEYMVRATGYLKTLDDFRSVPVGRGAEGTPILLKDLAWVQRGPEIRRGISELDGAGEVVGGVIVMRFGKNALETIDAVKAKLETLKRGLPLGVLMAFIVMRYQGVNANIMSLGGIAIAIGAMVDAAIVMIENAHKHLERAPPDRSRAHIIIDAASEVGPALFFSLLVITVSFLPIFALEAQEGRLFKPLAYTKTFAM